MRWLRAYATLLEARHPDRVSFSFESDPRVEKIMVPRLLLQPLVENAVMHGALSREEGGQVRVVITMEAEPGHVVCTVEDDGPRMRREHREGGIGLRLLRERLATHALGGRLTYHSTSKGTRAVLELPQESPS
ncbi:MAG TPA: ATP-binding protein [Polyangium sp.]|nr:ATP-binding protein [Polyangium sp.]